MIICHQNKENIIYNISLGIIILKSLNKLSNNNIGINNELR